jgi:GT2 family glycosyltransferase
MTVPEASIVIATRDRQEKLRETLGFLRRQTIPTATYEIVVVDDGSLEAVANAAGIGVAPDRVVTMQRLGRAAARNHGAAAARGSILVFVDDDLTVRPDFLERHLEAHREWPRSLIVGAIRLPEEVVRTPFGRFRQRLEEQGIPRLKGPVQAPNFCTAANMSIARDVFEDLGGFAPDLSSGEDQDLALRYSAKGGRIVFLPEALAVHRDDALDLRSYCRRTERGSSEIVQFVRRQPEWIENVHRHRRSGPTQWGSEPLLDSIRKCAKQLLARDAAVVALFGLARLLERAAPKSRALDHLYRLLLGLHIFRGYRRTLSEQSG